MVTNGPQSHAAPNSSETRASPALHDDGGDGAQATWRIVKVFRVA
jgi:hypothetical protein